MNNYIVLDDCETKTLVNGLCGNTTISFIQGDTYTYVVKFEDPCIAGLINKMLFVCNYFNIEVEFAKETLDDGTIQFYVDLDTSNSVPITTSYDVVAYIRDDEKEIIATQTDIPFIVQERENKLKEVDSEV